MKLNPKHVTLSQILSYFVLYEITSSALCPDYSFTTDFNLIAYRQAVNIQLTKWVYE